jgi:uncharacterized protein (UPF0332 family)
VSQDILNKQKLIAYRLKQARETLQDAHLLTAQGGTPGSIINRAYYAMFYAVLALLTSLGKGASKHSGAIAQFDQFFVKTDEFSKDMSKAIHRAFDLRQMGDYRELFELDREQANAVLRTADQFIEAVEKHLSSLDL